MLCMLFQYILHLWIIVGSKFGNILLFLAFEYTVLLKMLFLKICFMYYTVFFLVTIKTSHMSFDSIFR